MPQSFFIFVFAKCFYFVSASFYFVFAHFYFRFFRNIFFVCAIVPATSGRAVPENTLTRRILVLNILGAEEKTDQNVGFTVVFIKPWR